MGRVTGKVAIVTGAARGLGAAFAKSLVEEGASVMLTDILDDEGQAIADALGAQAKYLHHDVSSASDWASVVSETEKLFGPVTVLINNAAIYPFTPIEKLEIAEFQRVFEVNQLSVLLGLQAVIPSMREAKGGSIINMSSLAGILGTAGAISYNATKFAVRGMTKGAALELAPDNIRVNSIHPGTIRTPALVPDGSANDDIIGEFLKTIPAKRMGEPAEVANIALLLASDESPYITGSEFVIDGGAVCQ